MPFCPKCHTEYLEGKSRCPDCDTELVKVLPLQEEHIDVDSVTVLLYKTNDIVIVRLLEESLQSEGIYCVIKSSMGTYSGMLTVDQVMRGIKIYVNEAALERAVEIAETIIPDFERLNEKD